MDWAFEYAMKNSIELSADYPYVAWDQDCAADEKKGKVKLQKYVDVAREDPAALMAAVAQ